MIVDGNLEDISKIAKSANNVEAGMDGCIITPPCPQSLTFPDLSVFKLHEKYEIV